MVSPIYNLPTLDFVAGETQSFRFHLLTAANSPYDANACDVAFAIINYTNKTGTPLIVKDVSISIGESGIPNVASVELLSDDTIYLYGRYVYQLSIRDAFGETEIPGLGIMNITKNIHQAFITG